MLLQKKLTEGMPKSAQFVETIWIEMRIVEIAEEQADRGGAMHGTNLVQNLLRGTNPGLRFFRCEAGRDVHEAARGQQIDFRFHDFVPELTQRGIEIRAPEAAMIVAWITGVPDGREDAQALVPH